MLICFAEDVEDRSPVVPAHTQCFHITEGDICYRFIEQTVQKPDNHILVNLTSEYSLEALIGKGIDKLLLWRKILILHS